MSKIYHYTSPEALALILESRKLRFNRTDRVDDVSETRRHSTVNFGCYFFVSCWTYDQEESIPQWHMYTDRMQGVRIALPAMPFQRKLLVPRPGWKLETEGEIYAPLSLDEQFGQDYFVIPTFMKQMGGAVEYVDNVEARYEDAITITVENGQIRGQIRSPFDLVRLKQTDWAFQKEYRFALFILPSIPVPPTGPGSPDFVAELPNKMANALLTGEAPGIEFFDVDLADEALNEMEVTVGPLCSRGAKLSVQAVVEKYVPKARVTESRFTGGVRSK